MTALRLATAADAPSLAEVFVGAWRGDYRGLVSDEIIDALSAADWAARFAAGLRDQGDGAEGAVRLDAPVPSSPPLDSPPPAGRLVTVVATEPGTDRVLGFARYGVGPGVDHFAAPDDGRGYLAALYVHPSAAGHGVGRALLRHVLDRLSGAELTLWVFENNARARRMYQRAGFRCDGARLTDPDWGVPQIRMARQAVNRARPLPALADLVLPPIRRVEIEPIHRPLRGTFRTALREVSELRAHEVRLITADGLVGRGTTVATPQITGDTDASITAAVRGPLADAVRRAGSLSDGLRAIHAALPPAGGPVAPARGGVAPARADAPSARAAVDLALHDLARQVAGEDLASLLGNAPAAVRSDMTVSVDRAEVMAAKAVEAADDGFDTIKVKLADASLDVARVRAVSRALAGRPVCLRLDANQAWTREQAVAVLDQLADLAGGAPDPRPARPSDEPIRITVVEQPVVAQDVEGLAFVRARSPFPILADEAVFTADDARRVADLAAADMVNLKLLKCGGLWPARDIVRVCAEAGLGLLIGCMMEPAEGTAVASALAAAGATGPHAHDLDAAWWAAPLAEGAEPLSHR